MARTALTVQTTSRDGITPSYAAGDAVNNHEFNNQGQDTILHVKNGGGVGITVTIPTPGTVDGLAIPDRTVSIPAGEERMIGPFLNNQYGNVGASGGTRPLDVYVDLDTAASVTLAAFKLGSLHA